MLSDVIDGVSLSWVCIEDILKHVFSLWRNEVRARVCSFKNLFVERSCVGILKR